MRRTLTLCALTGIITACGGGGDSSDDAGNTSLNPLTEYNTLSKTDIEPKHLTPVDESTLLNHLKNGIRLNVHVYNGELRTTDVMVPETAFALDAEVSGTSASDSFSETNVHVGGVDEADYIKYDGQYIYLATGAEYREEGTIPPRVRILQTQPESAGVEEVGSIQQADDNYWGGANTLYLHDSDSGDQLVTLRTHWNYIARPMAFVETDSIAAEPFVIGEESIEITAYDLSNPSDPDQAFRLEVDGYLQDSRKIGNTLYLVTQFSPNLDHINYVVTEDEAQANEDHIADLSLEDFLPQVRINGGPDQMFLSVDDCLIPTDTSNKHGYASLTTIIAVDMETQSLRSAKCLNASVGGFYATQDSLYIGGSRYANWRGNESFTVLHKFMLDDDISYRSTGIVPGHIGWQSAGFRMSQHNDHFRIVTTTWDASDPDHQLSILRDDPASDEMVLVSTLPNETNPDPIGKPGEDLYAVRFDGERAYAVTFERIDPLYVLDLSDEEAPVITGELEIPGFSTYLHPVNDELLLTIGQDADDDGRITSLKVSLFDISDIEAPSLINDISLGNRYAWSSALYDLHALSFLQSAPNELRFTMPINLRDDQGRWLESSLHLFEVAGQASDDAGVTLAGKVVSEERSEDLTWPRWSGIDRAVLHDDAVYYAHGNGVWAAFWDSPESASGPH